MDGEGKDVQLIDVRMEDTIYEADAWRLVWVLIWKLDVDFPYATLEGRYLMLGLLLVMCGRGVLTFFGSLESYVEFLPAIRL